MPISLAAQRGQTVSGPRSEQRLDFRDEIPGGEVLPVARPTALRRHTRWRMLRAGWATDRGNHETESNAQQFVQSAHFWFAISSYCYALRPAGTPRTGTVP
jgi:hypothetical protein